MTRWLQIALLAALATAGFAAAAASARPNAGFRLVATVNAKGVVVKALGAKRVSFVAPKGVKMQVISASSARLTGVWLADGSSQLRLLARVSGTKSTAALALSRRRRKPPVTTTTATTTVKTTTTAPTTTTVKTTTTTPTTTTVKTTTTTPTTTTVKTTTTTPTTTTTSTPAPPARGAAAPLPPAAYAIPAGAVTVSTAAQLSTELAKSTPENIVLADGDYTNASAFSNANGHHLYAAHLGRAVLHAGIVMGGNYGHTGGSIQGLAFDITSASAVSDNAIVDAWGAMSAGISVQDTTFDGHSLVGYAINVTTGEGFSVARIVARNFTSDGIYVDAYPNALTYVVRPTLSDVDISNVSRPVPKSANGTSEACIWLGTPVTLSRAKLRNCAWMGLWTGSNGLGSTYSDVDVDGTPVGIYMEHFTTSSTFSHLHIGSGVRTGITCEWADPAWGSKPASVDNVITDSLIEANNVGVYMDEGTTRTSVKSTTFRGQAAAAIVDYKGVSNAYSGNDYTGIAAGAVAVSNSHL